MAAKIEHLQVSESKEAALEVLEQDGVVIIEGMVEPNLRRQINSDMDPFLSGAATTASELNVFIQAFLGDKTRRVGGIPGKSRAFCDVMTHPMLGGVCDEILLKVCASYQMNVGQVIEIGPGETEQILHRDEDVWPHMPRPCGTFQVASMTALGDFSEEIGATRIVPGSHTWEDRSRQPESHEVAVAEMPAGAMAVYLGGTIHGAGANRSADRWRRGIHLSFIAGWLRTEENNYLSVPPDVACQLPKRAQALLGYEMHDAIEAGGGIAGYVELRDPMMMLREKAADQST